MRSKAKLSLLAGLVFLPGQWAWAAGPFSIELDGFADYSTIGAYTDVTSIFESWKDVTTNTAISTSLLSDDNYPLLGNKAQASSYLRAYPGWMEGAPGNRPVVNYRVTWDGGGASSNVLFINRTLTNFTSVIDPISGVRHNSAILPFQYDDSSGQGSLSLRIDNSIAGTTTAVSNLHIIPTQYIDSVTGKAPTFREEFLRKVSPFTVLRMMDWEQTTGGTLPDLSPVPSPFHDGRTVDWVSATVAPGSNTGVQGRPTTSMFGRTGVKGVPMEEIVELANVTGKNLWINVPDRATTNYVTQLGNLLYNDPTKPQNLHAPVDVYVEYSNELWNTFGNQRWQRVLEDAKADTTGTVPVNDGIDPTNNLRLIYREAAKKLVADAAILKTQVGPAGAAHIKPVLAGQTPTSQLLKYGLEYLASTRGVAPGTGTNLSDILSGVAVAPYVGNDVGKDELFRTVPANTAGAAPVKNSAGAYVLDANGQQVWGPDANGKALSLDTSVAGEKDRYLNWLFPNLQSYIQTVLRPQLETTKALADKYNLPLLSYEGGQHLVAFNSYFGTDLNGDLKVAANQDPRMGVLYHDLTSMWWQVTGNQMFTQFALASPYGNFGSWGAVESLNQTSSPKWDAILDIVGGDANLDGVVNFADFQILEANFNKQHANWANGDFNVDGVVDYSDFLIFRTRFVPTAAPAVAAAELSMVNEFAVTAPEPGTLGVLGVLGGAALARRRRRVA